MTTPSSPVDSIAKAMEGVTRYANSHNPNGLGFSNGITEDERGGYVRYDDYQDLASQAEAMKREMAEKDARIAALEEALAGDHEVKPLSEARLEEILEFEEQFKMCGGAGDTASLDWSTQRALIDEAVLAFRARALIGGGNAED